MPWKGGNRYKLVCLETAVVLISPPILAVWPSGKAADFESVIPWFESRHRSRFCSRRSHVKCGLFCLFKNDFWLAWEESIYMEKRVCKHCRELKSIEEIGNRQKLIENKADYLWPITEWTAVCPLRVFWKVFAVHLSYVIYLMNPSNQRTKLMYGYETG